MDEREQRGGERMSPGPSAQCVSRSAVEESRRRSSCAETMSGRQVVRAIRAGRFLPGDAVCYRYARPSLLAQMIRRVQRRALRDLYDLDRPARLPAEDEWLQEVIGVTPRLAEMIEDAAGYTHVGMILDAARSVEMTSPRARCIAWDEVLTPGDRIRIVRPRERDTDGTPLCARLAESARLAEELALRRQRYPWREILTYWLSSLPGALSAPHFVDYFRNARRDVCSGTVWTAWRQSGAVSALSEGDSMPEAWYPARMASDRLYLVQVAEFEVIDADDETKAKEVAMKTGSWGVQSLLAVALMLVVVVSAMVAGGCVAYRAPMVVTQWGPEGQYVQDRGGTQSRTTSGEQQVADTTAYQEQVKNTSDVNMPTAVDETKQLGTLKSGQSATGSQTQGRESATGTTGSGGAATGQEGGDAVAVGQTPTAGGGGGGQGGTGAPVTGGTTNATCGTCGKSLEGADKDADGTCDGCEVNPADMQ